MTLMRPVGTLTCTTPITIGIAIGHARVCCAAGRRKKRRKNSCSSQTPAMFLKHHENTSLITVEQRSLHTLESQRSKLLHEFAAYPLQLAAQGGPPPRVFEGVCAERMQNGRTRSPQSAGPMQSKWMNVNACGEGIGIGVCTSSIRPRVLVILVLGEVICSHIDSAVSVHTPHRPCSAQGLRIHPCCRPLEHGQFVVIC